MLRRRSRCAVAVAAALALAVPTLVGAGSTSAGARVAAGRDGTTSLTAVASCWEAKQSGGKSGPTWLQTPAMVAPQQFYCDQVTDGGGWVLIGRGREGWGWSHNGQGTPDQVLGAVNGKAAFAPRTLGAELVRQLLNGGSAVNLRDGVRLRRARNNAGTRWQEARLRLAKTTVAGRPAQPWSWAMPARMPLRRWSIGNLDGSGTTTARTGTGDAWAVVSTTPSRAERFTQGFAYGKRALSGTSNNYLLRTGQGRTFPFTQVYLRPRLMSANLSYPAIPDSGTPASTVPARPSNYGLDQSWGVAGSGDGRTSLYNDEVLALTQSGDTMFVGGNFKYAQRGAHAQGADKVLQPFLAAFDTDTAQYLPGFRPSFNGQVKALETLPSGLVVAGGEFTRVNGVAAPGIVALNPSTGAIASGWSVQLEERTSAALFVRTLQLRGSHLYVGGSFTHLTHGGDTDYARNAARLNATSGQPDDGWRPEFNGTVNDISVAPNGSRVYLVGSFTKVSGAAADKVAVLSAANAAPVTGLAKPTFSNPSANYQHGVVAVGDRVFYGGAQHMLFGVDASTFRRTSSTITHQGGDFQEVTSSGGLVLAGCHCNQYSYEDGTTWPGAAGWTSVDLIRYVGAWDAVTGKHVTDFYPDGITTRATHGTWAIEVDSAGTTWVGGDFTGIRNASGRSQWTGGFLRLPKRDTTPPSRPTGLTLRQNAQDPSLLNVNVSGGSSDSSGKPVRYEILMGDRVVVVRNATTGTIPMPPAGTRIAVRAIDREGNRSASTPVERSPAAG